MKKNRGLTERRGWMERGRALKKADFLFNLLRLGRSAPGGLLIRWMFAHMSFAIPVKRLRETGTLIAFHHPQPAYPVHILLVAKRAIRSFAELEARDTPFLIDLVEAVQGLVAEYNLESSGYRLIANGGKFQDIGQLHFHLISGERLGDESG